MAGAAASPSRKWRLAGGDEAEGSLRADDRNRRARSRASVLEPKRTYRRFAPPADPLAANGRGRLGPARQGEEVVKRDDEYWI